MCDFYSLFFSKQNISSVIYEVVKNNINFQKEIDAIISFGKTDIHTVEDEIKDIKLNIKVKVPTIMVLDTNEYSIMDLMYILGIDENFI